MGILNKTLRKERDELIRNLYTNGKSVDDIAPIFSLSSVAIRNIINKPVDELPINTNINI